MLIDAKDLPYVTHIPKDGRAIVATAFYDVNRNTWESYSPVNGRIFVLPVKEVINGLYVSKGAFSEDDVSGPFTTLILQHLTFGRIPQLHAKLISDLINALACVHQYFINLSQASIGPDRTISTCVVPTNLEYALTNFRSFFDLINNIVAEILEKSSHKKNKLPLSFREVVQKDPEKLQNAYGFTQPLISFYKGIEDVFMDFRALRDNVIHHGHDIDLFFYFPDGFALKTDTGPFNTLKKFGIWAPDKVKANSLGSLLSLLAFIVKQMLKSLNDLTSALRLSFSPLPEATCTGFSAYLRTNVGLHAKNVDRYLSEHWIDPAEILTGRTVQS